MKESKCDFFRSQIHYLGHMLLAEGIQPLPEKLDSIINMPAPENQTEVKQFLGLVGYYCKFMPHFSDISRPLAKLMRKDTPFAWMKQCHLAFNMLKDKLCEAPILCYPNSSKPYKLFTDTSKYRWTSVLTQEFETEVKGKVLKELHPITYIRGLFCRSQLNWAALTREAYAIYLSVKKLAFYITDADITLRSNHLPLKRFLLKDTLNDKVNNWAVELETYRIKFKHIKGKSNVLADTLSRLISIDLDVKLEPELGDYEFGQYCFKEFPKHPVTTYSIPLPSSKLHELQEKLH